MTRKSCAVGILNAIQRNHLNKRAANDQFVAFGGILFSMFYINNSWKSMDGRATNQPTAQPDRWLISLNLVTTVAPFGYMPSSVQVIHLCFFSHKLLKHKFRVLLEGHTFAVVTYSPIIEHLLMRPYWETRDDDKEWQYCTKGSAKKSWKLVSVTLKGRTTYMMGTANLQ